MGASVAEDMLPHSFSSLSFSSQGSSSHLVSCPPPALQCPAPQQRDRSFDAQPRLRAMSCPPIDEQCQHQTLAQDTPSQSVPSFRTEALTPRPPPGPRPQTTLPPRFVQRPLSTQEQSGGSNLARQANDDTCSSIRQRSCLDGRSALVKDMGSRRRTQSAKPPQK